MDEDLLPIIDQDQDPKEDIDPDLDCCNDDNPDPILEEKIRIYRVFFICKDQLIW